MESRRAFSEDGVPFYLIKGRVYYDVALQTHDDLKNALPDDYDLFAWHRAGRFRIRLGRVDVTLLSEPVRQPGEGSESQPQESDLRLTQECERMLTERLISDGILPARGR